MRDDDAGRGRRLLLAALLLWLAAGAGAYLGRRYLYNVLLGPFPMTRADLLAVADADELPEYFVTVDGDAVEVLFARAYTGGEKPYSMYALLRLGRRWLLLRVPDGLDGRRVTGTLEPLSEFEREHVLGPRSGGRDFLPCRLEATRYFRTVGWLTAVLPLAALAALAAGLTARARRSAGRGRLPAARA
jgi:hypothetical protein